MPRERVMRDILSNVDLSQLPRGRVGVRVGGGDRRLNIRTGPDDTSIDGIFGPIAASILRMRDQPTQGQVTVKLPKGVKAQAGRDHRGRFMRVDGSVSWGR